MSPNDKLWQMKVDALKWEIDRQADTIKFMWKIVIASLFISLLAFAINILSP